MWRYPRRARKTKRSLVVVLGAGLLVFAACNRDRNDAPGKDPDLEDRAGTTRLTGASWVANDTAIERIVVARCSREAECSNLEPETRFETDDKCVEVVRKHVADDLTGNKCSAGIDGEALDRCVTAIRSGSCTNPIDAVARLEDCRTGALCLSP